MPSSKTATKFLAAIVLALVVAAGGCETFKNIFPWSNKEKPVEQPMPATKGPHSRRPPRNQNTPATATVGFATDTVGGAGAQATGTAATGASGTVALGPDGKLINGGKEETASDLITEAGFDMIYPNFNRETGRRDPFVPVSMMEGDWETIKKTVGEKFRVIGTAMTGAGQIAMIQVGEHIKLVHQGDILENNSSVKSISKYDVVLEKDNREIRLTMFTQTRVAKVEGKDEKQLGKLDNINDLFKKYLENKFGEETAGEEGEKQRPNNFKEFLDEREKGRTNKLY